MVNNAVFARSCRAVLCNAFVTRPSLKCIIGELVVCAQWHSTVILGMKCSTVCTRCAYIEIDSVHPRNGNTGQQFLLIICISTKEERRNDG